MLRFGRSIRARTFKTCCRAASVTPDQGNRSIYTRPGFGFPSIQLGKEADKYYPKFPTVSVRFQSTATNCAQEYESAPESLFEIRRRSGVRNIAIIAHVDHGKTTLVDRLLQACSTDTKVEERLLDSGDLEKERGITITSKVTRCDHRGTVVNIVDTPGHADFCGEVDRILSLVDGVCLVVDAAEGPMAQTKYVLSRALSLGLEPMVLLNKVDRADGWIRIETGETESQLLDLFDTLGASEDQMEYLTLYASARDGWVTEDIEIASNIVHNGRDSLNEDVGMESLLDKIVEIIPEPSVHSYGGVVGDENSISGEAFADDIFSLAVVSVGYDSYLGRTCTGRINSGSISIGDEVTFLKRAASENEDDCNHPTVSTLSGLFVNRGISREPLGHSAHGGDIVMLSGVPSSIAVGDTLTKVSNPVPTPGKSFFRNNALFNFS